MKWVLKLLILWCLSVTTSLAGAPAGGGILSKLMPNSPGVEVKCDKRESSDWGRERSKGEGKKKHKKDKARHHKKQGQKGRKDQGGYHEYDEEYGYDDSGYEEGSGQALDLRELGRDAVNSIYDQAVDQLSK